MGRGCFSRADTVLWALCDCLVVSIQGLVPGFWKLVLTSKAFLVQTPFKPFPPALCHSRRVYSKKGVMTIPFLLVSVVKEIE